MSVKMHTRMPRKINKFKKPIILTLLVVVFVVGLSHSISTGFAGFWGGFIQIGVGFILMPILHRVMGLDLVRVNMHKVFIVMSYTLVALLVSRAGEDVQGRIESFHAERRAAGVYEEDARLDARGRETGARRHLRQRLSRPRRTTRSRTLRSLLPRPTDTCRRST